MEKHGNAIEPLSSTDFNLINKLEQVQLMFRHGLRVWSTPFATYFPTSNVSYSCNISTMTTRNFAGTNIEGGNDIITINKIFPQNEQRLSNTNCEWTQSLQLTYKQLEENAEIILDAYIGDELYHIMNEIELYSNITSIETLKLISTNYERTISSLTAFLYGFKNLVNETIASMNDFNFNVIIHDIESEPLSPNNNIKCLNGQWINAYNNDENIANTKLRQDFINSNFVKNVSTAFVEQGGVWQGEYTGYELLFYYCDGIDIPISNETWWDIVNISYIYDTLIDETSYGLKQQYCYYHMMSIPILNLFKTEIEKLIFSNNINTTSKFIVYSGHGSTLMYLLGGMNIWDFQPFSNGEMVTLEIYSADLSNQYIVDNNIEYLFRWTRKGKTLKYPHCDYIEGINDELCDLNILFQNDFNDVVSMKEWENDICPSLLDNCVCGYCVNDNDLGNDSLIDWGSNTFIAAIIMGVLIGVIVTYATMRANLWRIERKRKKSLWKGEEQRELSNYQSYSKPM